MEQRKQAPPSPGSGSDPAVAPQSASTFIRSEQTIASDGAGRLPQRAGHERSPETGADLQDPGGQTEKNGLIFAKGV